MQTGINMTIPRPEYPRPQFERFDWINLNGPWTYQFDFGCSSKERGLLRSTGFDDKIIVPFCPESSLSGVGHKDFINSMFYHRKITVPANWAGKKAILHFGAVDYECEVAVNGKTIGIHYGGSSSFEFDITDKVTFGQEADLVVRVFDDTRSNTQAKGKQCSGYKSVGCSYTRVTGIWQTVWLEPVDNNGLKNCRIIPDLDNNSFVFIPKFYAEQQGKTIEITVKAEGKIVGTTLAKATSGTPVTVKLDKTIPWSPENPFLYDITYNVKNQDGKSIDQVNAYGGLRKIHIEGDKIFLNNKRIFLRLVLDQGYYEDGIWTAPTDAALKKDIELSMEAGFNGARLHQKVFEERFHYWADKLGYLTWGESASWGVSAFSHGSNGMQTVEFWKSMANFTQEWKEILERDASHPSIIAWSPANETWPGNNLQLHHRIMTELYDLTKLIDPTRPCNETSGYHHAKTDLWTVHFYRPNAEELKKALVPEDGGIPSRNRDWEIGYTGQPYINDEFGGFMFIPPERSKFADNTWGYHGLDLKNEDELCQKIEEQVDLMISLPNLSGYCYTQLTDIEQEQNGIYNYDRTPKVTPGKLAKIFGKKPSYEQ
ncbi:MAG: beta-glucuronidase [Lentisphaerae bacterium]|jgi:beta-galactosidase/beta-glucuronidase|nr:beta-glucuronidase [Lentisphaerota bacterium]